MLLFLMGRPECEAVSPLLSAFLDGQLSTGDRERVLHHLASCAACVQELQTLQDTVALLHELPALPAPRHFTLTAAPREPARNWFFYLRTATATATACLVAVLMLIVTAPPEGRYGVVAPTTAGNPASATVITAPAAATPLGFLEVSPTVLVLANPTMEPRLAVQPASAPPEEPADPPAPALAASPASASKIGVQAEVPVSPWPYREIALGLLGLVLGLGGATVAAGRRQGQS